MHTYKKNFGFLSNTHRFVRLFIFSPLFMRIFVYLHCSVFFRTQRVKIILVFMRQDRFFCLQFLTLFYMVKILSQIIFFSASNYLFREKHATSPPPLRLNGWSVPNLFPGLSLSIDVPSS
jgi:hypothetical protein